jgi:2-oxoglutarate ferredoxin oxidoreductase subunit alpha
LRQVVSDQFKDKGDKIIATNHAAMDEGYEYAKTNCKQIRTPLEKQPNTKILLTGNHAISLGAIAGGVQYFSAYPMTPTSDILSFLAAQQANYPLVVKHAEDEISAINQAIGASYAGVRAMTASATGGYALMVEATSLAGVMETPLVITVGQRPGPATGLPTWTCQSDLQFILHAGHGEIPRIVFTPSTLQEHFEFTRLAFALAEKYQLVAFILSDKFALESYMSMPKPLDTYTNQRYSFVATSDLPSDDSYRRFPVTKEGYSPRSIPGQPHGLSITNSYEHDEFGYATESAELTQAMVEKRQRKLSGVSAEMPKPILIGAPNAELTLVSWGSTRLVLEEVVRQLPQVNLIHFPAVWPFPAAEFEALSRAAKKLVMVEGNLTGQMESLIRQETGIQMDNHIHRYDGRPFYVEELLPQLQNILGGQL